MGEQELYDRGQAEGLGMSYEDYLAISGNNTPVGNQADDNQSQAEADRLARLNNGTDGLGNISPGSDIADTSSLGSILDKIKSFTGLTGAQLAGLGLGGLTLASQANAAYNPKTPAQLLAMQPSNAPAAFTAAQMAQFSAPMKTGNQLERQYAADMKSPIAAGVGINRDGTPLKFAEGGDVPGALSQVFDSSQMQGLVSGEGGGQDDMVDARLSPGEYVFDAETVAMLGDGDNAAGARKLDELREQLRAHKRSAPDDEIAPPAEGPLSYLGASNNG